ncbi:MAG: hypothetical protein AAFQ87_15625 [Bacteroidota bacterium]
MQKVNTLAFLIVILLSCQNTAQTEAPRNQDSLNPPQAQSIRTEDAAAVPAEEASPYLVRSDGFFAMRAGQSISALPDSLYSKAEVTSGGGEFDVYNILDYDQSVLGYFYSNPRNADQIGDIIVISRKAITPEGFRIGTSFATIQQKLTTYEVHGSELEKRTHVMYNNLNLQLNFASNTYEMDESTVPQDARVILMWISAPEE